ncbi:MAG: hypothetical protein ACJA2S_002284 [Cyclobacteriaceae bacterium]|jgi:hypothetical protein
MKLNDIDKDRRFSNLLDKMGAKLVSFTGHKPWESIGDDLLEKLIKDQELELGNGLADLVFNEKGAYFRGRKVLLYIRDQDKRYYENGYKFHVGKCSTIQKFIDQGRQARYVISLSTNGVFKINLTSFGKIIKEGLNEELEVCMNCMKHLDLGRKSNFNLDHFLNTHSTLLDNGLFRDENRADINVYARNWDNISIQYRRKVNFVCEDCGSDKSMDSANLHCHHIDGDKSNNNDYNLKALCVGCHSKQPGHDHMRNLGRYI